MDLSRTLVIAPHPDDDVIAAAGLMQRAVAFGGVVRVVYVTDGENNPWPQRWMKRKWLIGGADRAEWAAMRRHEASGSLDALGLASAERIFLGLPDHKLASAERAGDVRLLQALQKAIGEFRPTVVVAPSHRDLHSDHRAIGRAAHAAAADIPVIVYVVHGMLPDTASAFRLDLTAAERERKRVAIECHRSQVLLSRARFLAHADSAETFYEEASALRGAESLGEEIVAKFRRAAHVLFGHRARRERRNASRARELQVTCTTHR